MKKLIPILFLFACSHKIVPAVTDTVAIKDSMVINYVVHDSVIKVPFRQLQMIDSTTAKTNQFFQLDSNNLHLEVRIDNKGKLTATCKADSLQFLLIWKDIQLQYYKNRLVTKTITVTQKVPTPYIPKWIWILLAINVMVIGLKITSLFYKPESIGFNIFKKII